jgi:hypothetical protein
MAERYGKRAVVAEAENAHLRAALEAMRSHVFDSTDEEMSPAIRRDLLGICVAALSNEGGE